MHEMLQRPKASFGHQFTMKGCLNDQTFAVYRELTKHLLRLAGEKHSRTHDYPLPSAGARAQLADRRKRMAETLLWNTAHVANRARFVRVFSALSE